jgi:hypothetical protein
MWLGVHWSLMLGVVVRWVWMHSAQRKAKMSKVIQFQHVQNNTIEGQWALARREGAL